MKVAIVAVAGEMSGESREESRGSGHQKLSVRALCLSFLSSVKWGK